MSTDFVITSENNPQVFRDTRSKGEAVTYSFDFTPWVEDNAALSTVTWTVEAGQATISGDQFPSNIVSALVSFPESGGSLIKIVADTTSQIYVVWLDILAKDLKVLQAGNDYHLTRRF